MVSDWGTMGERGFGGDWGRGKKGDRQAQGPLTHRIPIWDHLGGPPTFLIPVLLQTHKLWPAKQKDRGSFRTFRLDLSTTHVAKLQNSMVRNGTKWYRVLLVNLVCKRERPVAVDNGREGEWTPWIYGPLEGCDYKHWAGERIYDPGRQIHPSACGEKRILTPSIWQVTRVL